MRQFRDDQGRPWDVAVTIATAMRVRDMVRATYQVLDKEGQPTGETEERPLDLLDTGNAGQTFGILRSNFAVLGEALYAILSPQIAAKGMTREDFLGGLAGDSLDTARSALEDELEAFFPSRLRGLVAAMRGRLTEEEAKLVAKSTAAIKASGLSSGSAPGSSASTPESGHHGNSTTPPSAG